jgi:hypothetical protein
VVEEDEVNKEVRYKREEADLEDTTGKLIKIRREEGGSAPMIQEIKSIPALPEEQ